jgi:predicted nucleic acid-binding Zn ribbon protein
VSLNRRDPRPISAVIASLTDELEPLTLLAAVQRAWPGAVGSAIAAVAHPTAAREGTVIVSCESAVWAQELELMGPDLVDKLNATLDGVSVAGLRCRATPAASWARAAG